jgi:hypothetical protein
MPKYHVDFSNPTSCALGISDFGWGIDVEAASEEDAREIAISYAVEMSRTTGVPPNWLRISEDTLRRHSHVFLENG